MYEALSVNRSERKQPSRVANVSATLSRSAALVIGNPTTVHESVVARAPRVKTQGTCGVQATCPALIKRRVGAADRHGAVPFYPWAAASSEAT